MMEGERDTTDGGGDRVRLRLLDGEAASASALGGDGGWRVGPGVGGEAWAAQPPAECVVVRNAVRAGDRHEPWTLPTSDALAALADEACLADVDVELAVRLVVECALVCDDLREAGVEPAALDAAAVADGRVGDELDAAAAAYLRRLTGRRRASIRSAAFGKAAAAREVAAAGEVAAGRRAAPGGEVRNAVAGPRGVSVGEGRDGDGRIGRRVGLGAVVTVGLPLRLAPRLLAADLDGLVAAAPLERALAWETAAVLAGRTMSEWAPLAALRLRP